MFIEYTKRPLNQFITVYPSYLA